MPQKEEPYPWPRVYWYALRTLLDNQRKSDDKAVDALRKASKLLAGEIAVIQKGTYDHVTNKSTREGPDAHKQAIVSMKMEIDERIARILSTT